MDSVHIRPLPPEVVGQIAAGEVVERPAAAIKELVENSIDAGATAVTIDIKDGGLTSFRVSDNGHGIDPQDLRMAFERHATSKIRTADDLAHVQTLGFRGEALASIAAVAKVTCTTRATARESGMTLQNDGGIITDIREAACPEGTTFIVKDLFYNAPVRRKFMKKPQTEAAQINELMVRLILSRPEVAFRYISDGKTVYFSAGDGKPESAVHSIYGSETLLQLKKLQGTAGGLVLEGFIGVGDAARGNRAHQFFFLNGRVFRSALLSSAVEDACRQRVMVGRFPLCIIKISMPYESADVNVHPNKWEVRFQSEENVKQAIFGIISDTLGKDESFKDIPALFGTIQAAYAKTTVASETQPVRVQPAAAAHVPTDKPHYVSPAVLPADSRAVLHDSAPFPHPPLVIAKDMSEMPAPVPVQMIDPDVEKTVSKPILLLGVVFNTYILLEYEESMLLCDQHAVHERLLFERMSKAYEGAVLSQALLVPQVIKLNYREYKIFEEYAETLKASGFDAEGFGENTLQLRSVPIVLGEAQADTCLRDVLDELESSGHLSAQKRTDRIIQMACKHAVKAGEALPMDALFSFIRQMQKDKTTPTCPHGRPLVVAVTKRELEKRFHRIQG
jgi:DNA mismatch repair protein MutL